LPQVPGGGTFIDKRILLVNQSGTPVPLADIAGVDSS